MPATPSARRTGGLGARWAVWGLAPCAMGALALWVAGRETLGWCCLAAAAVCDGAILLIRRAPARGGAALAASADPPPEVALRAE